MNRDPAARRYARALFHLGQKAGLTCLSEYARDFAALAQAMRVEPRLLEVFKSPQFSMAEKQALIGRILQALEACPGIRDFCALLSEKNRLAILPDIQDSFSALLDEEKGVARGELVSSIELSSAKQKEIEEQLGRAAGQRLELLFSVDSTILGGIVLKVGDRVLDASLRAQLSNLKETIRRGV